jgi:hypothetical protein
VELTSGAGAGRTVTVRTGELVHVGRTRGADSVVRTSAAALSELAPDAVAHDGWRSMAVTSGTPFALGTLPWEDPDGRARLTIVLKATFSWQPAVTPAPTQLPCFPSDIPHGNDTTTIRFESDLVPFKPRTDVVLVGRAHAPAGAPVTQLAVGLQVGTLRRAMVVFGDRTWSYRAVGSPAISKPKPFTTMDLVYERAFGGIDSAAARYCKENLVGVGFIGKNTRESVDGKPLPNLEDPDNLIRSWDTHPKPVGFGFYGRGWMPRLQYAGTYDEQYRKEVAPAMPKDFSYALFNGAHPALQVEPYLRGDEEVELINASRESPLRFRLPGFTPKVSLFRWTTEPERWLEAHAGEPDANPPFEEEPVKMHLDTLVFLPDDGIFYEVFRGSCALSRLDSTEIARITITE